MISINGKNFINDHRYHPLRSVLNMTPYRLGGIDYILERDDYGRPIRKIFGGALEEGILVKADKKINKYKMNPQKLIQIDNAILDAKHHLVNNDPEDEEDIKQLELRRNTISNYMDNYSYRPKTKEEKEKEEDEALEKELNESLAKESPPDDINSSLLKVSVLNEYNFNKKKYDDTGDGYGKALETILISSNEGKELIQKLTLSNSIIKSYDNYSELYSLTNPLFFPIGDIYNDKANLEVKNYYTLQYTVNIHRKEVYSQTYRGHGIQYEKKVLSKEGVRIQDSKFIGVKKYNIYPNFIYDEKSDKYKLVEIELKGKNIIPHSMMDYYIYMLAEDGVYYYDICNDEKLKFDNTGKSINGEPIVSINSSNFPYKKIKKGNKNYYIIPFDKWKKL